MYFVVQDAQPTSTTAQTTAPTTARAPLTTDKGQYYHPV